MRSRSNARSTLIHACLALLVLAAWALLSGPAPVAAQTCPCTFYVNADPAVGNDGNNGLTPSTAWLTLGRANNAVMPGDTVRLTGTFTDQQLAPGVSGTASAPIVFEANPFLSATLVGGSQFAVVDLTSRSFITIRGLRVRDVLPAGYGHAIYMVQASNNIIEDNELLNVGAQGSDSGDTIWLANGSSGNQILRNTFTNAGHALMFVGGDQPLDAEVGDNVIADNVFSNPWGTGVTLAHTARRTIVERNQFQNMATAGGNTTSAAFQCISSYNIIRRNLFVGNATVGILLSAYVFNTNGQDSIGNQIYHNVIYGGTIGDTFYGGTPIWIFEKDGRVVQNNLVANNIFFRNAGSVQGGQPYQIVIDHYNNPTAWPEGNLNGNEFRNNIILRQPGAEAEPMVLRIRNASQGGNRSYTLAQFQAAHATATNNLAVDPLFTDETNRVFTLQQGSPAIDAGMVIAGDPEMYRGAAPDIGAYETNF